MKRVIERSQEIRDQIMRSTGPDVRNEVAELCELVATLAANVESLEASESAGRKR